MFSSTRNFIKNTVYILRHLNFQKVNSSRFISSINTNKVKETVMERSDYPKSKVQKMFANDTISVIGFGIQGKSQALNLRDNGLNVIVGSRDGSSYESAKKDGFIPGKTLFSIEKAAEKGTVIMNLMSDIAQKEQWKTIYPFLTPKKTLYFSHGFSVVYNNLTNVIPPKNIDVILCAPKGPGAMVRTAFLNGSGVNSSVAVHQDYSGKAWDRAYGLGFGIGSGYLFNTTFKKETMSDLVGERGALLGGIIGLMEAQYQTLVEQGHTPSEAFNETCEEATEALYPMIGEKGGAWMLQNCSTTAQRGALDWYPKFRDALKPVFKDLYKSVESGEETKRVLLKNSSKTYKKELEAELDQLKNSEIWQIGEQVRKLRPKKQ